MSRFKCISLTEFSDYISNIKINRSIKEIHIHHTWKPDYDDFYKLKEEAPYKLYKIIEGMYNYHVNQNGWGDIGQNLTIDPDGGIWLCRDINTSPASILNRNQYAYAIENIGNFDINHDQLTKTQLEILSKVCLCILNKLKLDANTITIKYHNEYASKTCPGTNFPAKTSFINLIKGKVDKDSSLVYQETIKDIQNILNKNMEMNLDVDGIFGEKTFASIKTLINNCGTSGVKKTFSKIA